MSAAVSRYPTGTHEDGHRGESKFDSSSVPEAPIRPLFYPGVLRQQAGASLRARAYPLDLPFDSPEATSTMHLTDNCHSLYLLRAPAPRWFSPLGQRLPSSQGQGIPVVHATRSASADRSAGRWAFSSQSRLRFDRASGTPVARQLSPPSFRPEEIPRPAKISFPQVLVTGPRLP